MVSKNRQKDNLDKAALLLELSILKTEIADACKTFSLKPKVGNLVAFAVSQQLENLMYHESSERMYKALKAVKQGLPNRHDLVDESLRPFGYFD